jgi:hypothetical protein
MGVLIDNQKGLFKKQWLFRVNAPRGYPWGSCSGQLARLQTGFLQLDS